MPSTSHPKPQTLDDLSIQNLVMWSVAQAMNVSRNKGLMKQNNVLH